MTAYKRIQGAQTLTRATSAQEAKARRQAVLARVRKQRPAARKQMS
jgi:hypothetical protein